MERQSVAEPAGGVLDGRLDRGLIPDKDDLKVRNHGHHGDDRPGPEKKK